jgi:hypothetical protein
LDEYITAAEEERMDIVQFVKENEGTYNPESGHFLCTDCYIAVGCPSSNTGWIAP